jgi:Lrp/AsnC family transcriptional regulator, regulator for asnA, asnC and gidA
MTRVGEIPAGTVELDELDRRIMQLLRPDARRSYASIARAIGVSEPTVRSRVARMIKGGGILPWARVNPAAIGFPVDAMVGIRVKQGSSKQVGAKLAEMENIAYVAYTTGSFDILIEAHLPDNEGLFKFLNEELEHIEGIVYKETWHVLRTEKTNFEWEGENVGKDPLAALDRTESSSPAKPAKT